MVTGQITDQMGKPVTASPVSTLVFLFGEIVLSGPRTFSSRDAIQEFLDHPHGLESLLKGVRTFRRSVDESVIMKLK